MATSTGRGDWPLLSMWWRQLSDNDTSTTAFAVPYRITRDLDGASKAVWSDWFFEAAAAAAGQKFMDWVGD